MDTIDKLAQLFLGFPGIGPRQAKRFVYYLLSKGNGTVDELIRLLGDLKNSIRRCASCFRYFPADTDNQVKLCDICGSQNRDRSQLLIVEKDSDLTTFEKSGTFHGLYFVLGSTVPILEKHPAQKIRSRELERTVRERSELKEIILALSATAEGDNTQDYLQNLLTPLTLERGIKLSSLGRGLSTGTELEYSDRNTLKNALENRK